MKGAEIQTVKHRYQDVNKNEVKFRGKKPVDIEYENNKQKMQLLIFERNDKTLLLGMDWLKTFRLTIGNIRLDENSQSEKRHIVDKFSVLFRNNTTIKDAEINIQNRDFIHKIKNQDQPVSIYKKQSEKKLKNKRNPAIWKAKNK